MFLSPEAFLSVVTQVPIFIGVEELAVPGNSLLLSVKGVHQTYIKTG